MTTLQDKVDKLIPFIWERFIELDFEYDFAPLIRFHYFIDYDFSIPNEFVDFIDIDNMENIRTFDFDKAKDKYWDDYISKIIEDPKLFEKKSGNNMYEFIAWSRLDETWQYRTRDTIDDVLDKVIEFLKYLEEQKNGK